jgi:hypothetical protein
VVTIMRWTGTEARILRATALRMTIRDFAAHTQLSPYAIRDFETKGGTPIYAPPPRRSSTVPSPPHPPTPNSVSPPPSDSPAPTPASPTPVGHEVAVAAGVCNDEETAAAAADRAISQYDHAETTEPALARFEEASALAQAGEVAESCRVATVAVLDRHTYHSITVVT